MLEDTELQEQTIPAEEGIPRSDERDQATPEQQDTEPMLTTSEDEHHNLFMPIVSMSRADASDWVVEGQATAEVPDSYGTIFTYEASKAAFQRWIDKYANVREMHGKNAVGKGFGVQFDDANRRVLVRTRVSKAALDTWTKLQEGVLNGFSIGAVNCKIGRMQYAGKAYPAITSYDLAELSYVDNPSCPGSDAILMRADGIITEIVDLTDVIANEEQHSPSPSLEPVLPSSSSLPTLERVGARHSAETQQAMHTARDGAVQNAQQLMALCGCDDCQAMAQGPAAEAVNTEAQDAERLMVARIDQLMAPVYQRMQSSLARLASLPLDRDSPITDRLVAKLDQIEAALERVVTLSSLDEVRASLESVKGQVERIAAQPQPGGPILNGVRPVDKHLASERNGAQMSRADMERDVLERLHRNGAFQNLDDQIAAAASMLKAVPMQGQRY